jgi:hypothetical protein
MSNSSRIARQLFTCLLLAVLVTPANAQTITAAQLLPKSTVLYSEIPDPPKLIELLLHHPLRAKIEKVEAYRKAIKSPEVLKFQLGVGLFEGHMGLPWNEALAAIGEGGVYLAFDAKSEGAAVLVKAKDLDTLINLRKAVFQAIQVASQGKPDPIKKGEYRGVTAYEINKVKIAALDSWLLITNKDDLGKRIIDQHLDGGSDTLASQESFTTAAASKPATYNAWSYADIATIRDAGAMKDLYSGRTDNILAEMLFGGLVSNLKNTRFSTAVLSIDNTQLQLSVRTPHSAEWAGDRQYYFGTDNNGQAQEPIALLDSIFTLSTYRDLSQLWLRAGDLMTDKANDELAQADSQLTTFFSGKDFGEDILGSLYPELQFVVTRQNPEDFVVKPAIKLPAFAIVARLRDPKSTEPQFRRVFQSFVGFINVIGAMNGQPQLDLAMESMAKIKLVAATYVPESDDEDSKAKINFNFSPSLAFVGDRMVLSSSKQLATELARTDEPAPLKSDAAGRNPNTVAFLEVPALREILKDNQTQLIAQNMLDKGHSQAAAEQEIAILMAIIDLFQAADLSLSTAADSLQLDGKLLFRE